MHEEFSVTPVSTMPPGGSFGDRESCITIIDDDGESVSVYVPYCIALCIHHDQLQMPQ